MRLGCAIAILIATIVGGGTSPSPSPLFHFGRRSLPNEPASFNQDDNVASASASQSTSVAVGKRDSTRVKLFSRGSGRKSKFIHCYVIIFLYIFDKYLLVLISISYVINILLSHRIHNR